MGQFYMRFYVYIIYSKSLDKYYIGYTQHLDLRVSRHNSGLSRSTKAAIPWILVYYEEFDTKSDAIKRENYIKKMKSREYIGNLIKNAGGRPELALRAEDGLPKIINPYRSP